nr:SUN domain-containing protein 1 [Tanacetum cinerariifolium]
MGLDEIPGFAKGYEVGKFKTKIKVQVDRKLESEVSGLQSELGKRMDDENLDGVVNGNEMGLDEIPGFAKGVLNGNECLTGYEVRKFKTKMKVQVDKKLESKVSGLRSKETDAKIRSLEGVLNRIQWLTREEFDKFVEEFKGWKGGKMGLDEIRAFTKGVVEKEIEKLAKGVVDKEIEKNTTKALWTTVLCGWLLPSFWC